MANHSDDAPLAWVWSEYRGQTAGGAPDEVVELLTVAGRVQTDASTPIVDRADETPETAPVPGASHGSVATGPILGALILTIVGLLWLASSDNKSAAPADKEPAPATASEPAPSAPPPPAVSAPAESAPAASPPPAAPEPEKPVPRRQRRHR
jgi:hypothetical protein